MTRSLILYLLRCMSLELPAQDRRSLVAAVSDYDFSDGLVAKRGSVTQFLAAAPRGSEMNMAAGTAQVLQRADERGDAGVIAKDLNRPAFICKLEAQHAGTSFRFDAALGQGDDRPYG